MERMKPEEFLSLPTEAVAEIVRAGGPQVCVFPFNGTRRWFLLEHASNGQGDAQAYVTATRRRYIQMYQMLFDHGLDTILAPVFGGDILSRGEEYMSQIGSSMSSLAEHPEFLSFYENYGVRVRFYGDYRKEFSRTSYADILCTFDEITQKTAENGPYRLLYGVFASDVTENIAELAIKFHDHAGHIPNRRELIELYYGEYIERASIFIGFEKFSVFDYPMLSWGGESLYFTVAPSLYMNERQLRNILYDHIYLRPLDEPDYLNMSQENFEAMRRFYQMERETTLGVGEVYGGIWYAKSGRRE